MYKILSALILSLAILSCRDRNTGDGTPSIIDRATIKYAGGFSGLGYIWIATVDSIEYVIVEKRDGVAIIKHQDLHK